MANSKRAATYHPDDGPDAAAANRAELARLDSEGNPAVQLGRWAFSLYANPVLTEDEPMWRHILRTAIDRAKEAARLQGWWSSAQEGDATVTMNAAWAVDTHDEDGQPSVMYVGEQTALLMRAGDLDPEHPEMWYVWVHFPVAKLADIEHAAQVLVDSGAWPDLDASRANVIAGLEELAVKVDTEDPPRVP